MLIYIILLEREQQNLQKISPVFHSVGGGNDTLLQLKKKKKNNTPVFQEIHFIQ